MHSIKWGNLYPVGNTILVLVEHNIIISFPDTYSVCWMMIYLVDSTIKVWTTAVKKVFSEMKKGYVGHRNKK